MYLTDQFLKEIWHDSFAKSGKAWLKVTTGSMEPLVKPGEMILIQKVQPRSINFGDIVVFEAHGLFVAHRVIKKYISNRRMFFLQKGDNGGQAMEIPEEGVIGKVIAIEKINGQVLRTDRGIGRYINYLLSCLFYIPFCLSSLIAKGLKKIPQIYCLKWPYRLVNKLFNLLCRGITNLLITIIWPGQEKKLKS